MNNSMMYSPNKSSEGTATLQKARMLVAAEDRMWRETLSETATNSSNTASGAADSTNTHVAGGGRDVRSLLNELRELVPIVPRTAIDQPRNTYQPTLRSLAPDQRISLPLSSVESQHHFVDAFGALVLTEIQKQEFALKSGSNIRLSHTYPSTSLLSLLPTSFESALGPSSYASRLLSPAPPPYYGNHYPELSTDVSALGSKRLSGYPQAPVLADTCNAALSLAYLAGDTGKSRVNLTSPSLNRFATDGMMLPHSVAAHSTSAKIHAGRSILKANANLTSTNGMSAQRETFPVVLHQALLELERLGDTGIAAFLPDGKSFSILNQFWFERRIIRAFFPRMKGYASFQRQLNLYDFERIGGASADRGSYRHELFHRDSPAMACKMKRTKIKGVQRQRASSTSSTEHDASGE